MTKITIDRAVVDQALESLEALRLGMPDSVLARSLDQRIEALRAALAEDALQRLTDVQQETEAALAAPQNPCNPSCAPGYCYCEPVQEPDA